MTLPILYSFRRCPYAIRARLALIYANQNVVIREVLLSNKPESLLTISKKGTVPVMQLAEGQVVDESRDIIRWALSKNDPQNILLVGEKESINNLIDENDDIFKPWLDRYKYFDRFPEHSQQYYRTMGEKYLQTLDSLLDNNEFLFGPNMSVADISIMPFVRQFAYVDKTWFFSSRYNNLQRWLSFWLQSNLFLKAMKKYSVWKDNGQNIRQLVIDEDRT